MSKTSSSSGMFGTILMLGLGACLILSPDRAVAQNEVRGLEAWLDKAATAVPRNPADCRDGKRADTVEQASREIDGAAARVCMPPRDATIDDVLKRVERLLLAKAQVDRLLDELLGLRKEFAKEAEGEPRRAGLRNYLRACGTLTDLSGRLRGHQEEIITDAAYRVAASPPAREKLIDLLVRHRSGIGAEVMAWVLFDPPANAMNGAKPASAATKQRVLQLIAQTGNFQVSPMLARFVREERRYPDLVVTAADVLRRVGFPQEQRPGDKDEQSQPPITALQLLPVLQQIPATALRPESVKLRDDVVQWLTARKDHGLAEDSFRLGTYEVRPGDWMLLRNPSPYNRVTDVSPGLFTHVGVVTVEKGSDGRRRLVVADLTVRGTHIRVTNVDVLIRQYRHYLFLRHPDTATAKTMADVAASILGNEAAFDLNYRIDNVVALKGQLKQGKLIKSYCAGLLLLCGQETNVARARLFPIEERIAPGKTAKNLGDIGISFGANFVSPTGPLFSSELTLVGQREPVYDPANEIEQAVYDRFAECLAKYDLVDQWDSMQNMRVTLAEAAKNNPALARLLAQMGNVNPAMDLVSAAKAAAVNENLERIAVSSGRQFLDALFALTSGPVEELQKEGYTEKQIEQFQLMRKRHADLHRQVQSGNLDGYTLRKALVAHYIATGTGEIDKRFKTR
ncbi:MAG: hypothetical protein K2R98_00610 [Gemmataceae bacterium]|nr:hypothetical protein [Gemmataceae bacterium]